MTSQTGMSGVNPEVHPTDTNNAGTNTFSFKVTDTNGGFQVYGPFTYSVVCPVSLDPTALGPTLVTPK
jgi:hypothetical protein